MVSRTTFWEAILVIGASAIVTGIVILATNGDMVDHGYGNGLIVVGGILVIVALGALFLLPNLQVGARKQKSTTAQTTIIDRRIAPNPPSATDARVRQIGTLTVFMSEGFNLKDEIRGLVDKWDEKYVDRARDWEQRVLAYLDGELPAYSGSFRLDNMVQQWQPGARLEVANWGNFMDRRLAAIDRIVTELRSPAVTEEQRDAIRPARKDTEAIQQAPIIAVEDERWTNLFGSALILEMKLRIANGSAPFQIVSYTFEGSGGSGAYPSEGAIREQIRKEIFERQERLGPLIGMVNPNETVLRWVVNGFAPPPPNRGGTPGFVFIVYDATGNEHRMVRQPRTKVVVPIADAL